MNAVTKKILVAAGYKPQSEVSPVWQKGNARERLFKAMIVPGNSRVIEFTYQDTRYSDTQRFLVNELKLVQVEGFEREVREASENFNHDTILD